MENGYLHLKQVIPKDIIPEVRHRLIDLKYKYQNKVGEPRHNGSGKFWDGLELASTFDPNLWKYYTADFMFNIVKSIIPTPYLFNDQAVVKLPKSDLKFEAHYDNQFGPDPEGALRGDFKTINCSWILTNMNEANGCLFINDKPIIADVGDIVIIDGNTVHYSGDNKTNGIRVLYACVYSSKPIGNFQSGFYNEEFKRNTSNITGNLGGY